ncbi:MAG: hypothetical protein ABEI52_05215, partial [Halobacteriaceae archaeon]
MTPSPENPSRKFQPQVGTHGYFGEGTAIADDAIVVTAMGAGSAHVYHRPEERWKSRTSISKEEG